METARKVMRHAIEDIRLITRNALDHVALVYKEISESTPDNTQYIVEDSPEERIAMSNKAVDYQYKGNETYQDSSDDRFSTLVRHFLSKGMKEKQCPQVDNIGLIDEALEYACHVADWHGVEITGKHFPAYTTELHNRV
jgi:hypothetical protein